MKAYEIYQTVDPSLVEGMLKWVRDEERDLYKTTLATLAANRKLRPVFVQKKSAPDQAAWMHKTLKLRTSDMIGEHLFQVWLMQGQQDLLITFCEGMGIEHDGKGTVTGELPKEIEKEKLVTTVDTLVDKFDSKLVTLYLRVFNLQTPEGWAAVGEILESDERLKLV